MDLFCNANYIAVWLGLVAFFEGSRRQRYITQMQVRVLDSFLNIWHVLATWALLRIELRGGAQVDEQSWGEFVLLWMMIVVRSIGWFKSSTRQLDCWVGMFAVRCERTRLHRLHSVQNRAGPSLGPNHAGRGMMHPPASRIDEEQPIVG